MFGRSRTQRFTDSNSNPGVGPGAYDLEKAEAALKTKAYQNVTLTSSQRFGQVGNENLGPGAYNIEESGSTVVAVKGSGELKPRQHGKGHPLKDFPFPAVGPAVGQSESDRLRKRLRQALHEKETLMEKCTLMKGTISKLEGSLARQEDYFTLKKREWRDRYSIAALNAAAQASRDNFENELSRQRLAVLLKNLELKKLVEERDSLKLEVFCTREESACEIAVLRDEVEHLRRHLDANDELEAIQVWGDGKLFDVFGVESECEEHGIDCDWQIERDMLQDHLMRAENSLESMHTVVFNLEQRMCEMYEELDCVGQRCLEYQAEAQGYQVQLRETEVLSRNLQERVCCLEETEREAASENATLTERVGEQTRLFRQLREQHDAEIYVLRQEQEAKEVADRELKEKQKAMQENMKSLVESLKKKDELVSENIKLASKMQATSVRCQKLEDQLMEATGHTAQLEKQLEAYKQRLEEHDLLTAETSANFGDELAITKAAEERAKAEAQRLASENGLLAGHRNPKQKIHYLKRIKEENSMLKVQLSKAEAQIQALKKKK